MVGLLALRCYRLPVTLVLRNARKPPENDQRLESETEKGMNHDGPSRLHDNTRLILSPATNCLKPQFHSCRNSHTVAAIRRIDGGQKRNRE